MLETKKRRPMPDFEIAYKEASSSTKGKISKLIGGNNQFWRTEKRQLFLTEKLRGLETAYRRKKMGTLLLLAVSISSLVCFFYKASRDNTQLVPQTSIATDIPTPIAFKAAPPPSNLDTSDNNCPPSETTKQDSVKMLEKSDLQDSINSLKTATISQLEGYLRSEDLALSCLTLLTFAEDLFSILSDNYYLEVNEDNLEEPREEIRQEVIDCFESALANIPDTNFKSQTFGTSTLELLNRIRNSEESEAWSALRRTAYGGDYVIVMEIDLNGNETISLEPAEDSEEELEKGSR